MKHIIGVIPQSHPVKANDKGCFFFMSQENQIWKSQEQCADRRNSDQLCICQNCMCIVCLLNVRYASLAIVRWRLVLIMSLRTTAVYFRMGNRYCNIAHIRFIYNGSDLWRKPFGLVTSRKVILRKEYCRREFESMRKRWDKRAINYGRPGKNAIFMLMQYMSSIATYNVQCLSASIHTVVHCIAQRRLLTRIRRKKNLFKI